jgi:hypothetical protein
VFETKTLSQQATLQVVETTNTPVEQCVEGLQFPDLLTNETIQLFTRILNEMTISVKPDVMQDL